MLRRYGARCARKPGMRFMMTATKPLRVNDKGERLVLGIETSCDDSCASLVACSPHYSASSIASTSKLTLDQRPSSTPPPRARILNSIIKRQDHSATSGIHPLVAQHTHMANLPIAIRDCLTQGFISPDGKEVDAIGVTQGPGMNGCLSVGLTAAKTLAAAWSKPLIPVHHMEAHALTPFLTEDEATETPLRFPFLTLLLSGGHTMLVLARSVGQYTILATTGDDSIGDAFDKAATFLQIPTDWTRNSPGASLEAFAAAAAGKEAEGGEGVQEGAPAPLMKRASLAKRPEFSYSGLKSALKTRIEHLTNENGGSPPSLETRRRLASLFQSTAIDQVVDKVRLALQPNEACKEAWSEDVRKALPEVRHLVVSGGVASNGELRRRLADVWSEANGKTLVFPPLALCVDNAAMIAHVGTLLYDDVLAAGEDAQRKAFEALPRSKWSLEDL